MKGFEVVSDMEGDETQGPSCQLLSCWWLYAVSSSGQLTKPRSPRLLPEQKDCLTEVRPEALYQSRPWWGRPPWVQVSSHGPSFQGDPGSSLEWRGLSEAR